MARAIDVANFFIDTINEGEDDNVTNLKLQKLLYFSQGLYLKKTGKPLFQEKIQAWTYGPVVPQVYGIFKEYGKAPITKPSAKYQYSDFTETEKSVLIDTLRLYGRYTGAVLVSKTHDVGSPWYEVYSHDDSGKAVIPIETIQEYFLEKEQSVDFDSLLKRIPIEEKIPYDEYDSSEDEEWRE